MVLTASPGKEFKQGVLFEVVGVANKPGSVSDDSSALTERATLADLEAAQSGWSYDAKATGGTLYVKVGSGQHTVSVK